MRAIYLKQIRGMGLLDWLDEPLWFAPQRLSTSSADSVPQQIHIRWFVFGSDQGPDEKKCDKLIDMDVADSLLTLKVRAWCLRHILNLISKRQLQRLDKWRHNSDNDNDKCNNNTETNNIIIIIIK